MSDNGVVIFLNTSLETIKHRLENDDTRPLINTGNSNDKFIELEKLYHARKPIYKDIADYEISADNLSVNDVADGIVSLLNITDI